MEGYRLEARAPMLAEYRRICRDVGWEPVLNFDAAPASLAASLHCVVVLQGEEVVGMGRLVGDGAIYFYVQDVAVLREHQGHGLGARIVAALVAWLDEHAPERAFVGLFAAAGTEPFYERFGFARRDGMTGMFRTM